MKAFMLHKPDDPFSKVDLLMYSGNIDFKSAYQRKRSIKTESGELSEVQLKGCNIWKEDLESLMNLCQKKQKKFS